MKNPRLHLMGEEGVGLDSPHARTTKPEESIRTTIATEFARQPGPSHQKSDPFDTQLR